MMHMSFAAGYQGVADDHSVFNPEFPKEEETPVFVPKGWGEEQPTEEKPAEEQQQEAEEQPVVVEEAPKQPSWQDEQQSKLSSIIKNRRSSGGDNNDKPDTNPRRATRQRPIGDNNTLERGSGHHRKSDTSMDRGSSHHRRRNIGGPRRASSPKQMPPRQLSKRRGSSRALMPRTKSNPSLTKNASFRTRSSKDSNNKDRRNTYKRAQSCKGKTSMRRSKSFDDLEDASSDEEHEPGRTRSNRNHSDSPTGRRRSRGRKDTIIDDPARRLKGRNSKQVAMKDGSIDDIDASWVEDPSTSSSTGSIDDDDDSFNNDASDDDIDLSVRDLPQLRDAGDLYNSRTRMALGSFAKLSLADGLEDEEEEKEEELLPSKSKIHQVMKIQRNWKNNVSKVNPVVAEPLPVVK